MRVSDAWRRADQQLLDSARGVTLETQGALGPPVRLLLANLLDPSLGDPAVVVGSLLIEIADATTEAPAMELATFRALGRLQDGAQAS